MNTKGNTQASHQGILATAWLVARYQTPLLTNRKGVLPTVLLVVAPVVIAAVIAIYAPPTDHDTVFYGMVHGYYVQFAVGVLLLGIGLAGFPSDEANGTLAYLLTKPVPRAGVLLGRIVPACAVGAALVLVSISASGVVLSVDLATLLKTWPALLAASCYYGVLFTVVPLATTKAAAVGLIYVLVWESVMSVLPGAIHTLTATYYVRALLPQTNMFSNPSVQFLSFLSRMPSEGEAVARLAFTCVVWVAVGGWLLRRREYSASRDSEEGA